MDKELYEGLKKMFNETEDKIVELTEVRNSIQLLMKQYEDGLPPDRYVVDSFSTPSRTIPNLRYAITKYNDGSMTCSCPSFEHRGTCKHL